MEQVIETLEQLQADLEMQFQLAERVWQEKDQERISAMIALDLTQRELEGVGGALADLRQTQRDIETIKQEMSH